MKDTLMENKKLIIICLVVLAVILAALALYKSGMFNNNGSKMKLTNLEEVVLVGNAEVIKKPVLDEKSLSDFKVKLKNYGDSVTYLFDIENSGKGEGTITTLTKDKNPTCTGSTVGCDNIRYMVRYTDTNSTVTEGDTLSGKNKDKDTTREVMVSISYVGTEELTEAIEVSYSGVTFIFGDAE